MENYWDKESRISGNKSTEEAPKYENGDIPSGDDTIGEIADVPDLTSSGVSTDKIRDGKFETGHDGDVC